MDGIQIRTASVEDAAELLELYSHYVRRTAISFEWEIPTLEEFQGRVRRTLEQYPYLIAHQGGKLLGYAYAGPFVGRAAYGWSAELTIYLAPESAKRGIGRALYEALERALAEMGVCNLYACVGVPAEEEDEYLTFNSAQFHAHMGFVQCGEFHRCGCKFGRWYSMVWMEKLIGPHSPGQSPVRPFQGKISLDKALIPGL
ncbi:Phosphinothricin N-acetyltransferase [Firmicutes bacterium ASF500]|nr:Phosphinothricin N-acetyltransferase [Firmicutes bacterium ASF500]